MPLPGEELYGEKPLFNRFSRQVQSFPRRGVFLEKQAVWPPKIPPLKTGRKCPYYEHITSAILDQNRADAKVCRSSGIGNLFDFIGESAIDKKFSRRFSSPSPRRGWGGTEMTPGAPAPGPGKRDAGTVAPRRDLDTADRTSGGGQAIRF